MKKNFFLILSLILLCCNLTIAQNNNCKECIYTFFKKMAIIAKPGNAQVYFIDLKMTNTYNPSAKIDPVISNIIIQNSADFYYYDSEQYSFYMDKLNSYAVFKTPKKIIKGFSSLNKDDGKLNNLIAFQDSIFRTCSVVKCNDANDNGNNIRTIFLKPNKSVCEKYKIKMLCYKYNLSDEMLSEANIYYEDSENIIKQTTVYNKIDFNYKKKIPKNASTMIFTSSGKLQKSYYGYEFIDNTKNN